MVYDQAFEKTYGMETEREMWTTLFSVMKRNLVFFFLFKLLPRNNISMRLEKKYLQRLTSIFVKFVSAKTLAQRL